MRLRIHDLFYLYKSNGTSNVALRGLNLEVESGECLVINGPNGSGKSTLVKILTGALQPSAGQVFFDDMDMSTVPTKGSLRTFVSSIDQNGLLLADFTMSEYLSLSRALTGVPLNEAESWAMEKLASYGLQHLSNVYPKSLSAGERQICTLLAAMAIDPKILIADEPSGELDDESSAKLFSALSALSGKTTVVIVSHDPRAEVIADRVVRIHKGRISETWVPGEEERSVPDPFGWIRVAKSQEISTRSARVSEIRNSVQLVAEAVTLSTDSRNLFSDIDFVAHGGQLVIVSGKSGSGRSSFLRILAGLQIPTSGSVFLQDQILTKLSQIEISDLLSEKIGFVGQKDLPIERLSLQDHLQAGQAPPISDFAGRMGEPLGSFSGGERARIELLRVFSQKKPILILDEPTSSLDEERAEEIFKLIFDYVADGGLVFATSREEVLLTHADQIVDLSNSPLNYK